MLLSFSFSHSNRIMESNDIRAPGAVNAYILAKCLRLRQWDTPMTASAAMAGQKRKRRGKIVSANESEFR